MSKNIEYFEKEKARLRAEIKEAKRMDSDKLADLQADLYELCHDEKLNRIYQNEE